MPDYREPEDTFASRHAAEWGLASLLMGGVLAIIAPVTLVFNLNFWVRGPRVLAPGDMELAFLAAVVGVTFVLLLCLTSLAFSIKAWRSASANYQPAGLPVAGTLISLLSLGMWVIVGGDLIFILYSFTH